MYFLMSEDSDTPILVYNAKLYGNDREEWIPPVDDAESLKEENRKLKKQLRKEKQKNKDLKKKLEEARALAPILINE